MGALQLQKSNMPAQTPAAQRNQLTRWRNALRRIAPDRYELAASDAPTSEQRTWLIARQAELHGALLAAPPKMIAARIARLFLRFPMRQMEDAHAEQVIAAYTSDLSSFPLWAVDAAILSLLREPRAFPPSSPEVRARTEKTVAWAHFESRDIARVLKAEVSPPPDPAARERTNRLIEEVVAELKRKNTQRMPRHG